MDLVRLGKEGPLVSRMCFGGLIIGPLQSNLSPRRGGEIIAYAMQKGINFVDTAELYGTYPHIREAIRLSGQKPIISAKCYAYDRQGAEQSIEKARKEMDIDYIDIFMMHEQESRLTLRGHREALEYYIEAKQKGIIKYVGVSTHHIEVVEAAAEMPEIDIIHPIVNKNGLGIVDGSIEQMLAAISIAKSAGKGIFAMKPLGGGNLVSSYDECMKFILNQPNVDSIAVGMQCEEEIDMNVSIFEGIKPKQDVVDKLMSRTRQLHIDYWCNGCGSCVRRCGQNALEVRDGKAQCLHEKCVLCGYCSAACPQFAIKIC